MNTETQTINAKDLDLPEGMNLSPKAALAYRMIVTVGQLENGRAATEQERIRIAKAVLANEANGHLPFMGDKS